MKKISVNKNEYNLINNDERYSNLLNNLKNKGITLIIKDNAPDTFIIKKDVKIVSETSEVTINKCYKKLEKIAKDEIIIPVAILKKYNLDF